MSDCVSCLIGVIPSNMSQLRGKVYGYARCSTDDKRQDVERQVAELYAMGANFVIQEYASGTKADRQGYLELMAALADGDTLFATEVSRVTRSLSQLCQIIEIAKAKNLLLRFGALEIDCAGGKVAPFALAMLQIMGVFAELERNMTAERINSGLAMARANGAQLGRPKKTAADIPQNARTHWPDLACGNISVAEYAARSGFSRPTAYKYAKLLRQEEQRQEGCI